MIGSTELEGRVSSLATGICEAVPGRCSDCFRPEKISRNLAARVIVGSMTFDEAQDLLRYTLDENCPDGLTNNEPGNSSDMGQCRYVHSESTLSLAPVVLAKP